MRWLLTFVLAVAVLATGTVTSQARVAHADSDVLAIDTMTSVDDPDADLPGITRLSGIYPNPFNPSTTIAFDLASDGRVELAIYDVRGRLVSVVDSGYRTAGRHQAIWNGQDRDGRAVASGTYFCRFAADGITKTVKLLLAK